MFSLPSRIVRNILVIVATACAFSLGTPAWAQREDVFKNSEKVLSAFRSVVAKPSESTVRVRCDHKDCLLGTVVGPDGWILTKASDLKAPITCKLKDGTELDAAIVGVEEKYDLAMLKVDAKHLQPVEWRDSKEAAVGNWVATPGLGEDPVAVGVVSVATRKGSDRWMPNPKSGFLGISLPQSADDLTPRVEEVIKGTAAEGHLKKGDIILTIDGEPMKDKTAVPKKLSHSKPGDEVTFKIKRGDEEMELKIKLGKRPQDRGDFQNLMGGPLSDRRYGFPVFLQHDTVLRPTECGGPLVDLDGKTVGVNIARAGRVESYAIPSEAVKDLLNDLMSGQFWNRSRTT